MRRESFKFCYLVRLYGEFYDTWKYRFIISHIAFNQKPKFTLNFEYTKYHMIMIVTLQILKHLRSNVGDHIYRDICNHPSLSTLITGNVKPCKTMVWISVYVMLFYVDVIPKKTPDVLRNPYWSDLVLTQKTTKSAMIIKWSNRWELILTSLPNTLNA